MDTIDWMVSDVREHIFQVGLRINAVEFARADQRVHGCCTHTTTIRPGE